MNTTNQLTTYTNPFGTLPPQTPNTVLGKRPLEENSNQVPSSSSGDGGPSVPDYLSKMGVTKDQFYVLQKFVNMAKQSKSKKSCHIMSRKDYQFVTADNQVKNLPFTITRRNKEIFVHLKKLENGGSKKAKAIVDWDAKKIFTRMVWMPATQLQQMQELKILKLAIGLEGVVQLRRDRDIKNKNAFILDYYPSDLYWVLYNNYLPMTDILGLLIQAATGFNNLHNKTIVHGDIKQQNILVDFDPLKPSQGKAVVSDFDKSVTNDQIGIAMLSNGRFGSLVLMAPEMQDINKRTALIFEKVKTLQGTANSTSLDPNYIAGKMDEFYFELGKKMDVYSFGIMLREALLRMKAGEQLNPRIKLKMTGKEFELSSTLLVGNNRCPQAFNDIPGMQNLNTLINRALSDDPWSRPTMEEMLAGLTTAKQLIPSDLTVLPVRPSN